MSEEEREQNGDPPGSKTENPAFDSSSSRSSGKVQRRRSTLAGEKPAPPPLLSAAAKASVSTRVLSVLGLSPASASSSSSSSSKLSEEEQAAKREQRRKMARSVAGLDPSAKLEQEKSHLDFRPPSPPPPSFPGPSSIAAIPARPSLSVSNSASVPTNTGPPTLLQQLKDARRDAEIEKEALLAEITELKGTISVTETKVSELLASHGLALAEKDRIYAATSKEWERAKEDAAKEMEQFIASMEEVIARKDHSISERDKVIAANDLLAIEVRNEAAAQVDLLNHEVAKLRAEVAEAEPQLSALTKEVEHVMGKLDDAAAETERVRGELQSEISALRDSLTEAQNQLSKFLAPDLTLEQQDLEMKQRREAELQRHQDRQKSVEAELLQVELELETQRKELEQRAAEQNQQRSDQHQVDEELYKTELELNKRRAAHESMAQELELELEKLEQENERRRLELRQARETQLEEEDQVYRKEVDLDRQRQAIVLEQQKQDVERKKWQEASEDLYRRNLELELERKRLEAEHASLLASRIQLVESDTAKRHEQEKSLLLTATIDELRKQLELARAETEELSQLMVGCRRDAEIEQEALLAEITELKGTISVTETKVSELLASHELALAEKEELYLVKMEEMQQEMESRGVSESKYVNDASPVALAAADSVPEPEPAAHVLDDDDDDNSESSLQSPVAGDSHAHYFLYDKVEAQFEGALGWTEWYAGTISRVGQYTESGYDDTYDVTYDDGDVETDVQPKYIRIRESVSTSEAELIRRKLLHASLDEAGEFDNIEHQSDLLDFSHPKLGSEAIGKHVHICTKEPSDWLKGIIVGWSKKEGKHDVAFRDHSRSELDLSTFQRVKIQK